MTSKFDLSWAFQETDTELITVVIWDTSLYKKSSIELFFERFKNILLFMAENSTARLYEVKSIEYQLIEDEKNTEYIFDLEF